MNNVNVSIHLISRYIYFGATRHPDIFRCGYILDQALATPAPVIIEAIVDPHEPPLPAKISLDQAAKFAESLIRGEPNREKIILTAVSDKVRELI